MNTKTRGEKIDRFIEDAKAVAIKGLLIVWAILTIFLAVGFAGNYIECKKLNMELKRIESEYSELNEHIEAIYVYRK